MTDPVDFGVEQVQKTTAGPSSASALSFVKLLEEALLQVVALSPPGTGRKQGAFAAEWLTNRGARRLLPRPEPQQSPPQGEHLVLGDLPVSQDRCFPPGGPENLSLAQPVAVQPACSFGESLARRCQCPAVDATLWYGSGPTVRLGTKPRRRRVRSTSSPHKGAFARRASSPPLNVISQHFVLRRVRLSDRSTVGRRALRQLRAPW